MKGETGNPKRTKGHFPGRCDPLEVPLMASVNDVAAYILQRHGTMTAMKLQKLVYYSQAWSLVWDGKPLFAERIEAWAAGPVVPALYYKHRGDFQVTSWPYGNAASLQPHQVDTINAVLQFYGSKTSQWLSDLTHREDPWIRARHGLAPLERGNREIRWDWMEQYYSAVQSSQT